MPWERSRAENPLIYGFEYISVRGVAMMGGAPSISGGVGAIGLIIFIWLTATRCCLLMLR
jgi:hypothetical protein